MLLSIIIPIYNGEKTIEKCISSIQAQSLEDYEIIAINDGSVDATGAILKELADADNRVRVFTQANKGASSARNLGLRNMNGQYFTFVDCDDEVLGNIYDRAINVLASKELDMLSFSYEVWYGEGKYQLMELKDEIITGQQLKDTIAFDDTTYGGGFIWNRIFTRSFYDKRLALFREDITRYEDKLWLLDLFDKDASIGLVSDVGYRYTVPSGSGSREQSIATLSAFSQLASRGDLSEEATKKCAVRYGLEFAATMKDAVVAGNKELSEELLLLFQKEPVNIQNIVYTIMQNGSRF